MTGQGRGRGESAKIARLEKGEPSAAQQTSATTSTGSGRSSSETGSTSDGDKPLRGRGGFRAELRTIPTGLTELKSGPDAVGQPADFLANFIKIKPMSSDTVYQYRVDFEPELESVSLRSQLFRRATDEAFARKSIFDSVHDARSSVKLPKEENQYVVDHPTVANAKITITVKLVGTANWAPAEMLRIYNINMKKFLRELGFFAVSRTGAYVHVELSSEIGTGLNLMMLRGFRTSANLHENGQMMMNLEAVHKLMQRRNVLQIMAEIRTQARGNNAAIPTALVGKLVVTSYNKQVYRIEDVSFTKNPTSTFPDERQGRDISYIEYYKTKHDKTIREPTQPLLLVTPNNRRREEGDANREIYLVPELCNLAGLTDEQRNNNRLRGDLIRSSQIAPQERVEHMGLFLEKLHNNDEVRRILNQWQYSYETEPVKIKGRILPFESIGMGRLAGGPPDKWAKADKNASFENSLLRESLAKAPSFPSLRIIISRSDFNNQAEIIKRIRTGFEKVGLVPQYVQVDKIEGNDNAHAFVQALRNVPPEVTAILIILPYQNKEKYDAIKKELSVSRGIISQVVTSRLMMDDRSASGAAVKIAIQVAAKVGGEPWYISLPLSEAMVCGYDTYHDTANRGRSFGAFMASMNKPFSRWWSKADQHDRLEELSSHLAENMKMALENYKKLNGKYPTRVFLYRDGVGDGQLEHVYKIELKGVKQVLKNCDSTIRMAVIVVNKRVGARFYMRQGSGFGNPPPGTIIDDVVTRQERYDFYLISQSTRQGTVAPTYYNIIYDTTGLPPFRHQAMAFKLTLGYYNWAGAVSVPAPCQYAHKLALLCGEHLHAVPHAMLDDRLHFL